MDYHTTLIYFVTTITMKMYLTIQKIQRLKIQNVHDTMTTIEKEIK